MVIKKDLSATVGKRNTRSAASSKLIPVKSNGTNVCATCATSLCILGGLPNNTSIGISTG